VSIVPVLLFCSLLLVAGSIVLFVWSARQGDCHESDRLCLLPLEDDAAAGAEEPNRQPAQEPSRAQST
jgi:hypothetical protein